MDSDTALLEACLAGNAAARDGFVNRFAPVVYAAVRRTLGARPRDPSLDVEDVVQDVFLRLFKNEARLLRGYDAARASLSTWLTVVSRSAAIDVLRRKRPASVAFEEELHGPVHEEGVPGAEPFEIPEGVLSARQRLVMHLLFEKEWDVKQAAELLGVGEQTIRSTKHKALEKLRSLAAKEPSGGSA